jgi:hypothetical protein
MGSQMAKRLTDLRASRALLPRKIPGTQRLSQPQGHSAARRKNKNLNTVDEIFSNS